MHHERCIVVTGRAVKATTPETEFLLQKAVQTLCMTSQGSQRSRSGKSRERRMSQEAGGEDLEIRVLEKFRSGRQHTRGSSRERLDGGACSRASAGR